MDESLTIEIPDREGRFWSVTFESIPAPLVLAGKGPISIAFHAQATSGRQLHESTWGIHYLCERLWPDSLVPKEPEQRAHWYLRGILRYYRRHFDEILSQERFGRVLDTEDEELFVSSPDLAPIELVEREIEDLFFVLSLSPRVPRGLGPGVRAKISLGLPIVEAWTIYEPFLRERREMNDPLISAVYPLIEAFYGEYEQLSAIDDTVVSSNEANRILIRLQRLKSLGDRALRRLAAARAKPAQPQVEEPQAAAWPRDRAVHIHALTLKDLRCFQEHHVALTPPDEGQGQWIVLLGENGMGKTTVLRAIALALLREEVASAHLTRFSGEAPLIRSAPGSSRYGEVSIGLSTELAAIRISPAAGIEKLSVQSAPTARPPVFAYGCRRGSALGGPSRDTSTDPLLGADTLFKEDAWLVYADAWLRDLKLAASSNDRARTFFDAVCQTLQHVLLDVESISVEPERTWVQGPKIGRVPLAALSDGYLTTLGWIVDFIARWSEHARRSGYQLDEAFNESMPCVVLIDELDLHLHPRWQTEVITRLRTAFPLTTFIATTHNPLTLHGTRHGEVHVIREADSGGLEIIQRDLPPGIRTDQVLTGDWFGLKTTLDPETAALLEKHLDLLRQQRAEDDPERVALERQLRERLGHFADTPAERLAQELVAEHFDAEERPVTDDDRAALRKLYEQRVAQAARASGQSGQ